MGALSHLILKGKTYLRKNKKQEDYVELAILDNNLVDLECVTYLTRQHYLNRLKLYGF